MKSVHALTRETGTNCCTFRKMRWEMKHFGEMGDVIKYAGRNKIWWNGESSVVLFQ